MMRTSLLALVAIATLGVTAVDALAQQRRGRPQQQTARWAPVAIGVRGGWDNRARAEILGAQVRVPVVPNGTFALLPSADIAFLPNSKDYQYSLEAAWIPGGVRGGFFVSGGIGWRDTAAGIVNLNVTRETFLSYIVGAGIRADIGPIEFEAGFRWYFLDGTSYRPNSATLGINLPLWRAVPTG